MCSLSEKWSLQTVPSGMIWHSGKFHEKKSCIHKCVYADTLYLCFIDVYIHVQLTWEYLAYPSYIALFSFSTEKNKPPSTQQSPLCQRRIIPRLPHSDLQRPLTPHHCWSYKQTAWRKQDAARTDFEDLWKHPKQDWNMFNSFETLAQAPI